MNKSMPNLLSASVSLALLATLVSAPEASAGWFHRGKNPQAGSASAPAPTPTCAPALPPQAGDACLDLGTYLARLRAAPDTQFMHHGLLDLAIQSTADDDSAPSDLAVQHALDLFYHPNLMTLGIAAARSGGSYLHDFTAYQMDCAKVVTGDIFATEGMAVTWEIIQHSVDTLVLKRLSTGGQAELTGDLTLAVRSFKAVTPTAFVVNSVYQLKTQHHCAAGKAAEASVLSTTELFAIDGSAADPQLPVGDGLAALMAKYPREAAPAGRRGAFVHPISALSDSACPAAAPAPQPSAAPTAEPTPAPSAAPAAV